MKLGVLIGESEKIDEFAIKAMIIFKNLIKKCMKQDVTINNLWCKLIVMNL